MDNPETQTTGRRQTEHTKKTKQNTTQKLKRWATRTPPNTGEELR
jgi:hypothetical protein